MMDRAGCTQRHLTLFCLCLLGMVLLVSCSSQHTVPVHSRSQPPSEKIHEHEVAKGDTMFSIAWRYGLDYRSLASANNIPAPYTIYPGQRLRIDGRKASSSYSTSQSSTKKTYTAPSSSQPSYTPPASTQSSSSSSSRKATSSTSASSGSIRWQWPASGKVIETFSASGTVNKGIDIAGREGEAVKAAAAGSVVYAGTGLLGYGKLVIIKHNEQFLSAYAHNRILLVKEGDVVKAGEKIAEIGSSGTQKTKLHFEIRRNGKPEDPLKYLPRR